MAGADLKSAMARFGAVLKHNWSFDTIAHAAAGARTARRRVRKHRRTRAPAGES